MKQLFCCLLLCMSCSQPQESNISSLQESQTIERTLYDFHRVLARYYSGETINLDSVFSLVFVDTAQYVTYWGTTESIEVTKERIRTAHAHLRNYTYRLEIGKIFVTEKFASAFFILRQSYILQRDTIDEYLPTTFLFTKRNATWQVLHAHRSADLETLQQIMKRAARNS